MDSVLKSISINSILLDHENPRLAFRKIEQDIKKWSQSTLSEQIISSLTFHNLLTSIKENGIMDPIWVHDLGNKEYLVIEGNMRVTALKYLLKNKIKSTPGIDNTVVQAHIIAKNTSKLDIQIHKAVLQTGKTPWGPFNEASHIYELFWKQKLSVSTIANMLGKSFSYINNEIDNFKFYREFIEFSKQKNLPLDPTKYSFFKDAPANVRQKLFNTKPQREKFYKLITPNKKGITRIPNVSLKGGLIKTFNKFATNENVLQSFMKNERITSDQALLEFKGGDIKHEFPWTSKLKDIQTGINKLTKDDIKKIKAKEPAIYNMIVKISMSTTKMVEKK